MGATHTEQTLHNSRVNWTRVNFVTEKTTDPVFCTQHWSGSNEESARAWEGGGWCKLNSSVIYSHTKESKSLPTFRNPIQIQQWAPRNWGENQRSSKASVCSVFWQKTKWTSRANNLDGSGKKMLEIVGLLEEPATGSVARPSFGKSQQGRGGQRGGGTGSFWETS